MTMAQKSVSRAKLDVTPEHVVPSGWSNLDEDVFYRKVELYTDCWKLEFSRLRFIGCPCGGPIGVFPLLSLLCCIHSKP
jgi:hypothetical protein